jgi:type VI protein secretion system component VasK
LVHALLKGMEGRRMRNFVRVLVSAALCVALAACVAVPVPEETPSVALGQASIYRLEVALLVFYGCLLLITPAFSGLIRGRLPIEISARGARFAEEIDRSAELKDAAIEKLERQVESLDEQLARAKSEISRSKEGDST